MPKIIPLFLIILAFAARPGLAQEWGSYHNPVYGAVADVPPGFEPVGPVTIEGAGQLFRDRSGALLSIYGAPIPNGDFSAFVTQTIAADVSLKTWPIGGQTITPDWAEFWGGRNGRTVRVRMEATCNGTLVIATRFEYSGLSSSTADRVERSLTAGPASAC